MSKIFKRGALAFVTIVALLLTVPDFLKLPFVLLLGWISAFRRLIENVSIAAGTVYWVLFGVVILVTGTHWFIAWCHTYSQKHATKSSVPNRLWRWRWTFGIYAGLGLVLLGVMGLTGMVHQTAWMVFSGQPLFVSSGKGVRARIELASCANLLHVACDAGGWDLAKAQGLFWDGGFGKSVNRATVLENFQIVFLEGVDRKIVAAAVIPRDPELLRKYGFMLIEPVGEHRKLPMESLSRMLARERTGSTIAPPTKPVEQQ